MPAYNFQGLAPQYDYNSALNNRLGLINDIGNQQTTWEQMQNQRRSASNAQANSQSMQNAQLQGQQIGQQNQSGIASGSNGPYHATYGPFDNVGNFISAIRMNESGGSYNARNGSSGALGAYQIMPANIPGWSQAALGHSITPQQFMASPQLQDQIARYQLGNYYGKYGPAGGAIAWYAGEGQAQRYARSGQSSTGKESGGYPSQTAYYQAILKRMGVR